MYLGFTFNRRFSAAVQFICYGNSFHFGGFRHLVEVEIIFIVNFVFKRIIVDFIVSGSHRLGNRNTGSLVFSRSP